MNVCRRKTKKIASNYKRVVITVLAFYPELVSEFLKIQKLVKGTETPEISGQHKRLQSVQIFPLFVNANLELKVELKIFFFKFIWILTFSVAIFAQ